MAQERGADDKSMAPIVPGIGTSDIRQRSRLWLPIVMAIMPGWCTVQLFFISMPHFGTFSDLPPLYAACRLILDGNGSDVYNILKISELAQTLLPGTRTGTYTLLPPFAVIWLAPLGLLPAQAVVLAWTVLLSFFLFASLALCRVAFNLSLYATLWLYPVAIVFAPAYEAIHLGQLSPLLLLAFMLSIVALKRHKPALSGLSMSVMLLKPQLLMPYVLFLLAARKFKPILWLVLFGLLLTASSLLVLGNAVYDKYLGLLPVLTMNTHGMWIEGTPTLRGQLMRLFPDRLAMVNALAGAFAILGLVGVFAWGRKFAREADWSTCGIAAMLPLALLTSLYVQFYDLLLLVPAVVALTCTQAARTLPSWLKLASLLLLAMFTLPVYIPIHYHYLLAGGVINPEFLTLLLYTAAIQILLLRSRQNQPG